MANEALLKADLIDILSNIFQFTNFNQNQPYHEILNEFSATITAYMDSINSECKIDETQLCRLAPHYVKMDAITAGHYLVRTIDKDFNKLSLELIKHGADLTIKTPYLETPHSMATQKSNVEIIKAIDQKMESSVRQSLKGLGLNAGPLSTPPTTTTTAAESKTFNCCKLS